MTSPHCTVSLWSTHHHISVGSQYQSPNQCPYSHLPPSVYSQLSSSDSVHHYSFFPQHLLSQPPSQPEESPGLDSGPKGCPALTLPPRHSPIRPGMALHHSSSPWYTLTRRAFGSVLKCQLPIRALPRTCLKLYFLSLSLLYFPPSTEHYVSPALFSSIHQDINSTRTGTFVFWSLLYPQLLDWNRCSMNLC